MRLRATLTYSARPFPLEDPDKAPKANGFLEWLHPLHNGEAFGIAGRIAALLIGILPACLFLTGLVRWRQKRRSSMRQH